MLGRISLATEHGWGDMRHLPYLECSCHTCHVNWRRLARPRTERTHDGERSCGNLVSPVLCALLTRPPCALCVCGMSPAPPLAPAHGVCDDV